MLANQNERTDLLPHTTLQAPGSGCHSISLYQFGQHLHEKFKNHPLVDKRLAHMPSDFRQGDQPPNLCHLSNLLMPIMKVLRHGHEFKSSLKHI